eukprot:Skav236330  [mRNA]  locus=scaffold97:260015:269553:- [translate_table: standard]
MGQQTDSMADPAYLDDPEIELKDRPADALVVALLEQHCATKTPAGVLPGQRLSRKLPPMDGATVSKRFSAGSKDSSGTTASVGAASHSNGFRKKGLRPPCPVRRRASASDVYDLDSKTLANLLRRKGELEPETEAIVEEDNQSEADELPMTKAFTDMPRSTLSSSKPANPAEDEKIARQKHVVKLLLRDEFAADDHPSEVSVSATNSMSSATRKKLDQRRRTQELQADAVTEASREASGVPCSLKAKPKTRPWMCDAQTISTTSMSMY